MKKQLFILSIVTAALLSILSQQKVAAHKVCESYLDCHQKPENLEKIDYWSNYFFKLVRPEMRNKRVRDYHALYRQERSEIRRVVNKVIYQSCQQPQRNYYYLISEREEEPGKYEHWQRSDRPERSSIRFKDDWDGYYYDDEIFWDEELWEEGYYWKRTDDYFFEGLYRDLTDAVFYARHPELSDQVAIKSNLNWATEWMFIRQTFADFKQEEFLKEHLIPLCDRSSHQ